MVKGLQQIFSEDVKPAGDVAMTSQVAVQTIE